MLATFVGNLYNAFITKDVQSSQILVKTNIACLYRSSTSGIFYGIFTRGKRQVKKSLRTTDKELARRRLEDVRQKVARLNTKEGRTATFADFADRWVATIGGRLKPSSKLRRETAVGQIRPFFAGTVRAINESRVKDWAARRTAAAAARTFNIERETLIQILDYAISEGIILENPGRAVRRQKQPKGKVIIPSREQFRSMVSAMRQPVTRDASASADLAEGMAYSGMRLGEATELLWGDVNFDLKFFTVTGGELLTKNHEARTVPMFPAFERLLLAMRDRLAIPPQPDDKVFQIGNARKAIATACHRAGLPQYTNHTCRHFFCSNAIENGIDFKVIAGWLGHKDGGILVAKTYGHLRDEHSTAMAKRMTFDAAGDEAANVVLFQTAVDGA
jgi:integrase